MFPFLLSIIILFSARTEVEIEVSNIRSTEGKLMIAAYDSEKTFPKKGKQTFETALALSQTGKMTFTISLEPGTYAFAVFQDENNDKKLNKNFVGMPNEPYGFSNVDSMMPPDFDEAQVTVPSDQKVRIVLR